jgi:hypothetical protein
VTWLLYAATIGLATGLTIAARGWLVGGIVIALIAFGVAIA